MSQTDDQHSRERAHYAFNTVLATVAGLVGCLTLVLIFLALFAGLWLDNQFDSRPLFTIVILLGSVPVTLIMMFWVVRKATSRLKPGTNLETNRTEEAAGGE